MKTATFTSTIAPELIKWIDERARAKKRTRRAILEEAVRQYQRETMSRSLKEGFARAALDKELTELAEWGMTDYSDIVRG